ncbi:MAG: hypothetical protein M3619_01935 [Myxococcota bacterium]|nr:hypothetical protein [Myxococcota bacterium]
MKPTSRTFRPLLAPAVLLLACGDGTRLEPQPDAGEPPRMALACPHEVPATVLHRSTAVSFVVAVTARAIYLDTESGLTRVPLAGGEPALIEPIRVRAGAADPTSGTVYFATADQLFEFDEDSQQLTVVGATENFGDIAVVGDALAVLESLTDGASQVRFPRASPPSVLDALRNASLVGAVSPDLLYLSSDGGDGYALRRVRTAGTELEVVAPGAFGALAPVPGGIVATRVGDFEQAILRIDDGAATVLAEVGAGNANGSIMGPFVFGDHVLWAEEGGHHVVRRVPLAGGTAEVACQHDGPWSIVRDADDLLMGADPDLHGSRGPLRRVV